MPTALNQRLGARVNRPYILAQSAVPVCLAPNGTVATNGVVTLGTALPTIYSGGIWLRLPAGAVSGGLAGLYWAVMSSTTVGQVYTNFVDPASPFTPYIPSGTLTNATGSNSAYTQTTASDITLVNVTVPGGAMGANGIARVTSSDACNGTGGNKVRRLKLSSATFFEQTTTTTTYFTYLSGVRNRGTHDRNTNAGTWYGGGYGSTSAAPTAGTVNTAVDQPMSLVGQIAVATDCLVIEGFTIEILSS